MLEQTVSLDEEAPYMHVASSIRILLRSAMMLKILAVVSCIILTAAGERPPISTIEQTLIASPQSEARPEYAKRGSLSEYGPEFEAMEEEDKGEKNATKQLSSSIAELGEEAEDFEGVGTAFSLLTSSTVEFLNSAEMAAEVAGLENLRLVKALADHGASLHDRFQAFVLHRSLQIALGDDPDEDGQEEKEVQNEEDNTIEFEEDEDEDAKEDRKEEEKAQNEDDDLIKFEDDEEEDDEDDALELEEDKEEDEDAKDDDLEEPKETNSICSDGEIKNDAEALMRLVAKDDEIEEADVATSLRAFCEIYALHNQRKGVVGPRQQDLKDLLTIEPGHSSELNKQDVRDVGVKRWRGKNGHLYRLAKAMKQLTFIPGGNFPTSSVAGLRRIFSRALVQQLRISNAMVILEDALKEDWLEVRSNENVFKRMGRKALKLAKNLANRFSQAVKKVAASIKRGVMKGYFLLFKGRALASEQKCQDTNFKEDAERADKAGLKGRKAVAGELNEEEKSKMVQKITSANDKDIELMSSQSEEALDKVEKAGNGVDTNKIKQEMDDYTASTKAALQGKSSSNNNAVSSEKDLKAMKKTLEENEKKVVKAEEKLCKSEHGKSASSMSKAFKKAKKLAKVGAGSSLPGFGTRGVVAQLGPVAGGVEEILDFHNLEIAQFRFGLGFIGTSMIGASVGSYAGIGWKGYKQNWTLETTIGAGLYCSTGITFWGLPVTAGVTVAIDADDSGPVWKPDIGGAATMAFGISIGVSLPLMPITKDWGFSSHQPLHAECFDSVGDFIKYLWFPGCQKCEGSLETGVVTALRAGVKIASFPIIAETVHTVLALLYRRARLGKDPDKRPRWERCSMLGTSTRDDRESLKYRVLNALYENMMQLREMSVQAKDLELALEAAADIKEHVYDLYNSREYKKLEGKIAADMRACTPGPLLDAGSLYSQSTRPQSYKEVIALCEALDMKGCNDASEQEELKRARVGGVVSLSKGRLTVFEIEWLTDKFKPYIEKHKLPEEGGGKAGSDEGVPGCAHTSGQASQIITNFLKTARRLCNHEACMTGLQAAEELGNAGISPSAWKELCTHVNPTSLCEVCWKQPHGLSTKCIPLSLENLIQRILLAAGAGEVGLATSRNVFGMCSSDNDCKKGANLVCTTSTGYLPLKRCTCAEGYCLQASAPGQGEQESWCENAKSWLNTKVDALIDRIRDYIRREKLAIGELARDLVTAFHQKAPDNV